MLPLHLGIGAAYHGFLGGAALAVAVPLALAAALSLAYGVSTTRVAALTGALLLGAGLGLTDTPVLFTGQSMVLAGAAYLLVPYGTATALVRAATGRPWPWAARSGAVAVGAVLLAGTATGAAVDAFAGTPSLLGVRWFSGYLGVLAGVGVLGGAGVALLTLVRDR